MRTRLDSDIDFDWEVLLPELEERLYELEYETLGKDFWLKSEWNEIVQEKTKIKARVVLAKRKLRELSIE